MSSNTNPTATLAEERTQLPLLPLRDVVIFPHMVATVFAGLRLAMTLTLLGVVLAEIFVSQGGIGFYTLAYSETFNPAALMALVLTLALMAIALNELVRLVEARFSRWKD